MRAPARSTYSRIAHKRLARDSCSNASAITNFARRPGRFLVVGPCAVEEIGDRLIERLGEDKVYRSKECNDLSAVVESMLHLMKVSVAQLDPGLNPAEVLQAVSQAIENGTEARMIDPTCGEQKLR